MNYYFTIIFTLAFLFRRIVESSTVKVLIVGAGPSGLLTAQSLLSRGTNYEVKIIESRESPNSLIEASRSYSLGLNIRGQSAIKYFDIPGRGEGLLNSIRQESVESESFFLHFGSRKLAIRKKPAVRSPTSPPPTLMISRNKLSSIILNDLLVKYKESGRLQVQFGVRLSVAMLGTREAILDNGAIENYDLLVGADGVRSAVRSSMEKQLSGSILKDVSSISSDSFYTDEEILPGRYKVLLQTCPEGLENDAIHSLNNKDAGFSMFLIPNVANQVCALLSWSSDDMPPVLRPDSNPEDLCEAIAKFYPAFGRPDVDVARKVLAQRESDARVVRCNRYHDDAGAVVLLGDAAHSTGGTLGQGANSALMDVVALDRCLDASGDDIPTALRAFTRSQVPEGLALWELLRLPPSGSAGRLYAANQFLRATLPKRLGFGTPVQQLLSTTTTPFSEIVKKNENWVAKALDSKGLLRLVPSA